MLVVSVQGAIELEPHCNDPHAAQIYGALHLNAAMASAAMRRDGDSADRLDEAAAMAERVGETRRGVVDLYFGPDNVGS